MLPPDLVISGFPIRKTRFERILDTDNIENSRRTTGDLENYAPTGVTLYNNRLQRGCLYTSRGGLLLLIVGEHLPMTCCKPPEQQRPSQHQGVVKRVLEGNGHKDLFSNHALNTIKHSERQIWYLVNKSP